MSERMWPEAQEPRPQQEKIAEILEVLQEEYAVLTIDRELQMTEVEYQKMVDIKNRIPNLDKHEEGTLSEEVILAQLFLSMLVSECLNEMESYYTSHGNNWEK